VVYQRPCSNRLIPETRHWVDDIFQKIGVDRVPREYDRDNALCCGQVLRAHQRDDFADDVQKRNLDDMQQAGAQVLGVACPQCAVMFEDALKVENLEGQLEVKEISEIVNERIA
jgi:Fe-S oxidoreductase